MEKLSLKRLFFGLEIFSPWPKRLPRGRAMPEESRHLTLAFIGQCDASKLEPILDHFPLNNLRLGFCGFFDDLLFLPPKKPRVVCWHPTFLSRADRLFSWQGAIADWLRGAGYSIDTRPFLPHVTLARSPFQMKQWETAFYPLPFCGFRVHLYESVGHLRYVPLWSSALLPPFEEIAHTADQAFLIRGESLNDLYEHAFTALAFEFPEFLAFRSQDEVGSLNEVIALLNHCLATADTEVGAPFKAVCYSGEMTEKEGFIEWEMIVDV